ncbi:MAG: GGDEF domain-containing protein [Pseudomonadota bacterium]
MQTQILGLLTPLMALLFAITFAVFWKVGRMKRHVLGFATGYLLFAVGYLVTHFLPADALYTFHTTQLFYTASTILFVIASCERVDQRVHIPTLVGIYVVSAVAMAIAISITNDLGARLILVNIGYGAMFLVCLTTLLNSERREVADWAIIILTAFQAVDFFVRPTMTVLFEQSIPAEEYRSSIYYSLIGLVLGFKSMAGAMILMGATAVEWTKSLRESSEKDPLTGLHNRASFEDKMRSLIPRANDEGRQLSLVVADIDHFKQVNDIWGHQAGDRAISSFGELIHEMVRGCDIAGRVGGEEFCIAVWNCPNEPAGRLADRIRHAFSRIEHDGVNDDVRLTASFGVATLREGENYDRLFARADAALYQAKSSGRNQVGNAELGRRGEDDAETVSDLSPQLTELKSAASS